VPRSNDVSPWLSAWARVLADVGIERMRQDEKWGVQGHMADRWNTILGEEVGEVSKAINECDTKANLRAELIQVAAVASAWVEHLDRQPGESWA
jgi:NTP pyrophosphatase (non-canonical NTP hydrolase)